MTDIKRVIEKVAMITLLFPESPRRKFEKPIGTKININNVAKMAMSALS